MSDLAAAAAFPAEAYTLANGAHIVMQRATEEDMDDLKAVYYAAYGGRYTLAEVNDRDKMRWCLNDPNYLWLINRLKTDEGMSGIVCSVIFVVDPRHRIGKTFAGVVHPDFRGQKMMIKTVQRGRDFLVHESQACDLMYAVVRTFVSATFHTDLASIGFVDLGIFPNVRKVKYYETHGFKVYFGPDVLEKRRPQPEIIAPVARLYDIVRARLNLEAARVVDVELEPRPRIDNYKMVMERSSEVEWEYYKERDAGGLRFDFYPFHYPLVKLYTKDQTVAAYLFYQEIDGYASLLGLRSSGDAIVRDLASASEYAESLGVKYLEMLVSAYDPLMQRLVYEAGFLPCAYWPAAAVGQDGLRHDYVITSNAFVPPHFKGLKLTKETRPYLQAYYKIYTDKLWEDMANVDGTC